MSFTEFAQLLGSLGAMGLFALLFWRIPLYIDKFNKGRKDDWEYRATEAEAVRTRAKEQSTVYLNLFEKLVANFRETESQNREMHFRLVEDVNRTSREIAAEERRQCLEMFDRMDKRYECLDSKLELLIVTLRESVGVRANGEQR